MKELEKEFNRLKAYDPNDSIELYISSKILGFKNKVTSYHDIDIRYSDREADNVGLIGAMETLYTSTHEQWLQHREKVMTTYVKLIGCKERLLHREIERERSLF